jgi:hypothetical protein
MKFAVAIFLASVGVAPIAQNRWIEMDADDYASHARHIEYSGLFSSDAGTDTPFALTIDAERTTNAVIQRRGNSPVSTLYGSNDSRPQVLQDVIVSMKLMEAQTELRIPKAAYDCLLNAALPATLQILRLRTGIVVAFDGGTGEKHYACRLVFSSKELLYRQIREKEGGPVQVQQFN